jgi:hypothetical protein
MQWTRQLLRQSPVVRVPRSFVVRAADVARARTATRRSPVFALRWASSIVALLLVLVFAGDLLSSGLLTGARLASAPAASYEQPVERQVVGEEKAVATQEGIPSVVADEALQAPGAPSPTAEAAAKMAVAEQKVEPTSAAAAPVGAEAAPTETLPPLAVAPNATLPIEQTPTSAGQASAAQESTSLPAEQETVGPEMAQEALAATELVPTEAPGPAMLRGHEEGPVGRTGSWITGWRVAEISLGAVLLALVIAVIWVRLRR